MGEMCQRSLVLDTPHSLVYQGWNGEAPAHLPDAFFQDFRNRRRQKVNTGCLDLKR